MKKSLMLFVLFLSTGATVMAQNTFPASGNVGIGTATPGTSLDVHTNASAVNVGDNTNTLVNVAFAGSRGYVGYDGSSVAIQGAAGKGINFNVNSGTFGSGTAMSILSGGNVGIGTTTPANMLSIANNQNAATNLTVTNTTSGTGAFAGLQFATNNNGSGASQSVYFRAFSDGYTGIAGVATSAVLGTSNLPVLQFIVNHGSTTGTEAIVFKNTTGEMARLTGTSLCIGTTNPDGYQLAVNGSAIATSMTVKLFANWPDFVFNKNYHLTSLADLKNYIDLNHHLPEMPSEEEVKKLGLDLGKMDKLLTKKVEELTLYLMDKDKQLADQQKQIENMQKQLKELCGQLKALQSTK